MELLNTSDNKLKNLYNLKGIGSSLYLLLQVMTGWFASLLSTFCCRDVQSEAIFGCTFLDRSSTRNCWLEFTLSYLQVLHCKPSQWKKATVFFQYWKTSVFVHKQVITVRSQELPMLNNVLSKTFHWQPSLRDPGRVLYQRALRGSWGKKKWVIFSLKTRIWI